MTSLKLARKEPPILSKPLPKEPIDVVVIALSSPARVGLYREKALFKTFESIEKTGEFLPLAFSEILKHYTIDTLYFARGPGSYMSIKLVYLFAKTLALTLGVRLRAADGFAFCHGKPIKAIGNLYFVKEDGKISTRRINEQGVALFELPQTIDEQYFGDEIEPLYILPAV